MPEDKKDGAAAVAEKPAEEKTITAAEAAKVIQLERQARVDAATREINAILEKYGLELKVNQVVQLSFR